MWLYCWYFEFDPLFLWGTMCCGDRGVFHIYSRFLEFFEVKRTYKEWMHIFFLIFFHALTETWKMKTSAYEIWCCPMSLGCVCVPLLFASVHLSTWSAGQLHRFALSGTLEVQVNGCFVWMLFSILSLAVRVCVTYICSFYCWVEDSGVRTLRS